MSPSSLVVEVAGPPRPVEGLGFDLTGVDAVGVAVITRDGAVEFPAGRGGGVSSDLPTDLPADPRITVPMPGAASVSDIGIDLEQCRKRGFLARAGQTLVVRAEPGEPVVILVGFGEFGHVDLEALRQASAGFVRACGSLAAGVIMVPSSMMDSEGGRPSLAGGGQALAEGAVLATYRYDSHKTGAGREGLDRLTVAVVDTGDLYGAESPGGTAEGMVTGSSLAGTALTDLVEGVHRGVRIAEAVSLARDLVNTPASELTPDGLCQVALARVGTAPGVSMEVWDEQRIAVERLGGLLGVARGSSEPPRFLRAVYTPDDPVEIDGHVPHVVLVGKGITFDSGGLSLKTYEGMVTMKTDMSGAAAVLATVGACGNLGVRVKVTALAPLTENMPGGHATKPGDVLTIRDRQTIEVLNTDAEGRLVLADALSLAAEEAPDAIVDLATLTGACVVALGKGIAGALGNDDGLMERLRLASSRAAEPIWPLPLHEAYGDHIESEVADMKNVGKPGQAGAISAALLLEHFVGGNSWVHLDIAGPARSDDEAGYLSKGGTGFGVRMLIDMLKHWVDRPAD
ncbi:MAG: leucyl aminopeptidase family protein [Acidimicrobiales bacterium]